MGKKKKNRVMLVQVIGNSEVRFPRQEDLTLEDEDKNKEVKDDKKNNRAK